MDPAVAKRVRQYRFGVTLAFYDLKRDPGRRVNLIDSTEHAGKIGRMEEFLLQEMVRTDDPQLENFKLRLEGRQPVVPQDHPVPQSFGE